MSIPKLTLNTDKNNSDTNDDVVIRQSEKGLVLLAKIIDANNNAYDLTNYKVAFAENKNGNRMIDDTNVDIVDATYGEISYKLRPEVYQESGDAWFEVETPDGISLVDTTNNFHIEVIKQADLNVSNDNYWSSAADMLTHMKACLEKAETDLANAITAATNKANTAASNAESAATTAIADAQAKVDDATTKFNSTLDTYKSQLAEYDVKYKALDANWSTEITKFDGEIDTVKQQAVKDFQTQRDNLNVQFTQFEADLKSDLNSKLSDVISRIDTLVNTTMPNLNAKADAVQQKINQLKTDFDAIDFSKFVTGDQFKTWTDKVDNMYTNEQIDDKLTQAGKVKTVNGNNPDDTGNINIDVGDKIDTVQVDGHTVQHLLHNFVTLWGGDAEREPVVDGNSTHFFDQVETVGKMAVTNRQAISDAKKTADTAQQTANSAQQSVSDLQGEVTEIKNGTFAKTWKGTLAAYQELGKYDDSTFYYILSNYDVVVK